jgi:hypothetical protein
MTPPAPPSTGRPTGPSALRARPASAGRPTPIHRHVAVIQSLRSTTDRGACLNRSQPPAASAAPILGIRAGRYWDDVSEQFDPKKEADGVEQQTPR